MNVEMEKTNATEKRVTLTAKLGRGELDKLNTALKPWSQVQGMAHLARWFLDQQADTQKAILKLLPEKYQLEIKLVNRGNGPDLERRGKPHK